MRRIAAVLILLAILAAPSASLGWGGDGHQIVNLIAEARLTPEVQAAIHDLLGEDVDISDAEIASWADQVKRERRATSPWHYVNIPYDAQGFDAARDGKDGENIITKIGELEKILADKSAPKAERAEALKFIVHFVGDLHQPLHCVDRNGDKGGNGRLVFFGNRQKAVSLHQTWDSLILLRQKGKTRVLEYAEWLSGTIDAARAGEWERGSVEDWANESHRVAVDVVYRNIPVDGPPPRLTEEYISKSGVVIDEQLAKGGVRLASMLNRCLTR